jgi:hypothetical protein
MKNILLILFIALSFGCSKDSDVVTRQGIDIEFSKTYPQDGTAGWVKSFTVSEIRIWKAEGRNLSYNGIADRTNSLDAVTNKAIAPDYSYTNISKSIIELPAGQYFIAYITGNNEAPKNAYSYTTVSIKTGGFVEIKKNITAMVENGYTAW